MQIQPAFDANLSTRQGFLLDPDDFFLLDPDDFFAI
jgi:hypothetical protein